MSATERLKFVLTADASGAIKAFEKVGTTAEKELKKADSGTAKVSAQLTKFGTGAIVSAGVVGSALVGLAGNFSSLGVSVGKFSTATGLSAEKSSRWIEVAGDMGIEADGVESAINKMNRTAGTTPDKFAEMGAEIARTSDGAVDANQTFLNVIDRLKGITDPAERARVGTALLGKSWTGMSELIAAGSSSLTASLAAVNDAKVFDDAKVQKAKDYRAAMDTLKDSLEELGLSIGTGAAPVIATLASTLGGLVSAFGSLDGVTGGAVGSFGAVAAAGALVVGAISVVAGSVGKMATRFQTAEGSLSGFGKTAAAVGTATTILAGTIAGLDVLDKITGHTGGAGQALNELLAGMKGFDGASQNVETTANAFAHLADQTYKKTSTWDNFTTIVGDGFSQSAVMADTSAKAFDGVLKSSPKAAQAVVDAMRVQVEQAAAGSRVSKDFLDNLGITGAVLDGYQKQIDGVTGSQKFLDESNGGLSESEQKKADKIKETTDALKAQQDAQQAAREEALRSIDADFNYRASVQDTKTALEDYTKKTKDHKLSTEEQQIATDQMVLSMAATASAYAASKGDAEGSKAAIDDMIASLYIQAAAAAPGSALQKGLADYILKLEAINRGLTPEAMKYFDMNNGANMHMPSPVAGPPAPKKPSAHGATGGIVTQPTTALIGEAGPEMVIPLSSMPGASPLPSGISGGSGSTINLTVNAGLGTDGAAVGQQIVNLLKRYQRANGPFDFASR